jgi:hypothetical protein
LQKRAYGKESRGVATEHPQVIRPAFQKDACLQIHQQRRRSSRPARSERPGKGSIDRGLKT